MYPKLVVLSVAVNFVIGSDVENSSEYSEKASTPSPVENKLIMGFPLWKQHFWKPHKKNRNATYIDRAENMIRLPQIPVDNTKKKFLKKSPKRTIQKIIKKNRIKTKKIYVVKITKTTVKPETRYSADESQRKEEYTTAPPNQKKRQRKYTSKITRNQMPFHKLQKMNSYRRDKRNIRDKGTDVYYIMEGFNELQFTDDNKDFNNNNNFYNADFKNYF